MKSTIHQNMPIAKSAKASVFKRAARTTLAAVCALSMACGVQAAAPASAQAANVTKCYTIANANTPVYGNAGLSGKIGTIFASDELKVNSFSGSAVNVTYPIKNGTKTGWIKTSDILKLTGGPSYTSHSKFTTYRRPGGASYGSVFVGDQLVLTGSIGNWMQFRYNVSGGYKYAWAATSTVNAAIKAPAKNTSAAKATTTASTSNATQAAVRGRLDQIAAGTLKYNKSTTMTLNRKFSGHLDYEQCKGFAKNVFYLCFKVLPGKTQDKPCNYLLNATNGMTRVGYYSNISAAQAKSLFSKARPGDFVQIRRSHGGSHSAIVYSVSSTGITFFEANTDGKNTVMKNTYTWNTLAAKNAGMSLYTASSYSLK